MPDCVTAAVLEAVSAADAEAVSAAETDGVTSPVADALDELVPVCEGVLVGVCETDAELEDEDDGVPLPEGVGAGRLQLKVGQAPRYVLAMV